MITPDDLRTVDVFSDQDDDALAWLAGVVDQRTVAEGEAPFTRGARAEHMILVLDGAFQIFTLNGETRTLFTTVRAGEISGLLPFSRMETFSGEGVATADARLALLHQRHFPELLSRMPAVGERLVARMTDRVRESSRSAQQREKMVSLGKLSAGLAHELNNPAAAIQRAVCSLRERMAAMPELVTRLVGHGLTPDQVEAARSALLACSAPTPGSLSAIDRSEKEDALADWLDDHDVPEAYLLAEVLADEGVTPDALDRLAAHVAPDALADVVRWIEKEVASERLLTDVERAAGRIADLVASVKSYTHMDRAPERQPVDVHEGIDQTLTMLGHAVRTKNVHVERHYGDDVPAVSAVPGEINQVWTNLLDNALDAVPEGGRLEIRTEREGALVCVHLIDDGPGIPPDVQEQIFEPFFTTKDPGQGTGLGLDIARRIVAQHEGRISVTSEPGRTDFLVCLPVEAPRTSVVAPEPGAGPDPAAVPAS